jgi:hypothetical protein
LALLKLPENDLHLGMSVIILPLGRMTDLLLDPG